MFLTRRERPPDKSSAPSNKPSESAYKRTSIPAISPVALPSRASPNASPIPRRAPLAPLDPQTASSTFLDDQMASPPPNPASSHLDRPPYSDARDAEGVRPAIGRQIIARPHEDDADVSFLSSRKRSLSGHANSVRSLPYPPSRSVQRRASNGPSVPASANRRPSIPGIQVPSLNPPPPVSVPLPDPQFLVSEDIYSGLSTFRFGAAKATPPSQMMDTSDTISPLTRVPGSSSADRTPRPSISGASTGSRRKSYSNKMSDPAEGDDEYEDEDDEARGKSRSKMRAIDDGTRRPSLPTNSLIPAPSTPPPPSTHSPANAPSEASPGGRSSRSQESDLESSEPEGDEAETAEFDTDVELDMPQGNAGHPSMDPPVSDAASQRTFGAANFDYYGYWQPSPRIDTHPGARDDEEEEDVGSISPVTFTREYDSEGYDDGDRPLPSLVSQASRRGSLPWETLTPRGSSSGREREDSTMTIIARRASRSTDDLVSGSSEQPHQPRFDEQLHESPMVPASSSNDINDNEYTYGPYDLAYIMEGIESRKSWSSNASYMQPGSRRSEGDPTGLGAAWDAELRAARRPSTVTIGSSEDAFTRHIRALDPDYNAREERWSFRREGTDGRGPHRLNLASSPAASATSPEIASFTMHPGTQELWRQEFVGRFKVDRLRISPDDRARDKGPQQRLHIRSIPDPFVKGNARGGPHGVVHKHSKVVAFSIFRHNNVLPPGRRGEGGSRTPFDRSGGILLANKRVQEAYTSTHTTSRLNSHGLLADSDARGLDGTTIVNNSASISRRSRPTTPQRAGGSDSHHSALGHAPMDTARDSASPPPPPPPKDSRQLRLIASSSSEALNTSDSQSTDPADPSSSSATRSSTLFSKANRSRGSSHSSIDSDDSDSPPRTSHAEAFATVDSSYFELMRNRATQRHAEESQSSSRLAAFRKLFGPPRSGSSHSAGTSSSQREGNYIPPWVVLAPRSKQEESQRVIQNLNESFQDVGLLPTNSRSSGKKNKGKHRQEHREQESNSILEKVPKDSLYMLLPLWAGETDAATAKQNEDPSLYQLRVEDRQYLLVYYVPFEEKEKKSSEKKRSRGGRSPSTNPSGSIVDLPLFLLRSFRVNARLVSYDDLRGSGVRVPSYGLTITGSMAEAMRYLPSPSIREQKLDEVVICHCTSRSTGMKFDPDGLTKLGLCMPTDKPAASQIPDSVIPEQEEAVLTPIGRAAVEMAWLGCMAITSFGTV